MVDNQRGDWPPLWDLISRVRAVDLSQPLHPGIPRWPGDPPPEFLDVAQIQRDGYYLRRFSLGEHSGTHLNAPASFHPGGLSVDAYPASSLVAPAVVLDVRTAAANPDYALSPAHVLAWEEGHGAIPPGSLVLLYTGWQAKWDRPQEFLGLDDKGVPHFPGFSLAAARFLLAERVVAGLGIDTHGVDGGADSTFAVNRLVLEQPRLVLENLASLDQLPPTGAVLVIGRITMDAGELSVPLNVEVYKDDAVERRFSSTWTRAPEASAMMMSVLVFGEDAGKPRLRLESTGAPLVYPAQVPPSGRLPDVSVDVRVRQGVLGFFGARSRTTFSDRRIAATPKALNGESAKRAYGTLSR